MQQRSTKIKNVGFEYSKALFLSNLIHWANEQGLILVQIEHGNMQFSSIAQLLTVNISEDCIEIMHKKGDLSIYFDNLEITVYNESTFELLYENKDCITIDFL